MSIENTSKRRHVYIYTYAAHAHTYSHVRPQLVFKLRVNLGRAQVLGGVNPAHLHHLNTQPWAFPATQNGKAEERRLTLRPL